MAQLPKQGTYSGLFGWNVSSTTHELEEGHVVTQDVYSGTFFNGEGNGFLHETSWVCPGVTDTRQGKGTAQGHGIVTDYDNDKAYFAWKGTIDPEDGFNGDYRWTGGTGKYAGITGDNTFRATTIGETVQGRGLMKGDWKLP